VSNGDKRTSLFQVLGVKFYSGGPGRDFSGRKVMDFFLSFHPIWA